MERKLTDDLSLLTFLDQKSQDQTDTKSYLIILIHEKHPKRVFFCFVYLFHCFYSFIISCIGYEPMLGLAKSTGNNPVKIFVFPPELVIVAIVLSILISFLTGAYPSRRASRNSALNALRYE
ncbi:MAG: FtsX-like permease family protein [Patescibacteria group bacterium]